MNFIIHCNLLGVFRIKLKKTGFETIPRCSHSLLTALYSRSAQPQVSRSVCYADTQFNPSILAHSVRCKQKRNTYCTGGKKLTSSNPSYIHIDISHAICAAVSYSHCQNWLHCSIHNYFIQCPSLCILDTKSIKRTYNGQLVRYISMFHLRST
jgi:hypothetical protein